MNTQYYETLEENFNNALNFLQTEYTHEELIGMLENGNMAQKQIAALRLENILSDHEANVLVQNLTGQDGKVREAVSMKIREFMSSEMFLRYFKNPDNYNIFLEAIIDINANICRNIIPAVANLKNDSVFCEYFCHALTKLIFELFDIIDKFDFSMGKYKVNKEAFKLYWCLETVYVFWDKIKLEDLKQMVKRGKSCSEYTIREKIAKILTRPFEDDYLLSSRKELKNDENYYVSRF